MAGSKKPVSHGAMKDEHKAFLIANGRTYGSAWIEQSLRETGEKYNKPDRIAENVL